MIASATKAALAGLNAAGLKLEKAVANIARDSNDTGDIAIESAFQGPRQDAADTSPPDEQIPSPAAELVAFKEAEILYTASGKVLGALGKLKGQLLDITA